MPDAPLTAWEFFAGGGMARAGLGAGWLTTFANDIDVGKAAAYRENFGAAHFSVADVWSLSPDDLPGRADLAWASSPCQDFSLAGARAGLDGDRSSALTGFLRLMRAVGAQARSPRVLVIENVVGLLTSRGGADFTALCRLLARDGWRFGALEIDAAHFVPQSRPRLFVVGTREAAPAGVAGPPDPSSAFRSRALRQAFDRLDPDLRERWLWWRLPPPPRRNLTLAAVLEPAANWDPPARTERLLSLCSALHRARLDSLISRGERWVGAAYRRVRSEAGERVQRTELRFDGLAGCLRTPAGGSSRQFVVQYDGRRLQSRKLTAREGARLMGLPDHYRLPPAETAAWRVIGDGVSPPVVRWLADHLLKPLCQARSAVAA